MTDKEAFDLIAAHAVPGVEADAGPLSRLRYKLRMAFTDGTFASTYGLQRRMGEVLEAPEWMQAAEEANTLRSQLAHWKVFAEHAEGERSKEWARRRELEGAVAVYAATSETLRGERDVLVRLLVEADKVLSTVEGECQEEWDQLADLRRAIAAATIPHRPEEADLLSLRACLGA